MNEITPANREQKKEKKHSVSIFGPTGVDVKSLEAYHQIIQIYADGLTHPFIWNWIGLNEYTDNVLMYWLVVAVCQLFFPVTKDTTFIDAQNQFKMH